MQIVENEPVARVKGKRVLDYPCVHRNMNVENVQFTAMKNVREQKLVIYRKVPRAVELAMREHLSGCHQGLEVTNNPGNSPFVAKARLDFPRESIR